MCTSAVRGESLVGLTPAATLMQKVGDRARNNLDAKHKIGTQIHRRQNYLLYVEINLTLSIVSISSLHSVRNQFQTLSNQQEYDLH